MELSQKKDICFKIRASKLWEDVEQLLVHLKDLAKNPQARSLNSWCIKYVGIYESLQTSAMGREKTFLGENQAEAVEQLKSDPFIWPILIIPNATASFSRTVTSQYKCSSSAVQLLSFLFYTQLNKNCYPHPIHGAGQQNGSEPLRHMRNCCVSLRRQQITKKAKS